METKNNPELSMMTHLQNLINSTLTKYSPLYSKSGDLKSFSLHISNNSGMMMVDVGLHFELQEPKQDDFHQRKISDVLGYNCKISQEKLEISLSPMKDANSLKWISVKSNQGL